MAHPPIRTVSYIPTPGQARPGYLSEITDAVAGTRVKRITGTHLQSNSYPKRQPWNKNGTVIFLNAGNPKLFLDGTTYVNLNKTWPGGVEYPIWSNVDSNRMWGCSDNQNVIRRFNYSTLTWTVHHTFAGKGHISLGEYEGNISDDDTRIALIFKTTVRSGSGNWGVLVYDPVNDVEISSRTFGAGSTWEPNNCMISRSGAYVVVNHGTAGTGANQGVWAYDSATMAPIRQIMTTQRHADMGKDINGNDIYVHMGGSGGCRVHRLSNGTSVDIFGGAPITQLDSGHVSCTNYDRPGWAYLSSNIRTTGDEGSDWICAVKTDGSGQVELYAMGHGLGNGDYNNSPHMAANRTGDVVMWRSYWDGSPTSQVFSFIAYMPGPSAITGTAALSKGWSTSGAGSVGARGAAALSKGWSTAAAGKVAITGTASLAKGWSTAATGAQGLSAITGTAASSFRFGVSASGKASVAGAAASSFAFSTSGVGKPNGITGTSTGLRKGFSTAGTGTQAISGGVAASAFRFSTAAVGAERISATSATAFTFSTEGTGHHTLAAVGASSFTSSIAATGTLALGAGAAASSFRFSAAAVGVEAITGTGASTFGWQASRNEGPAASSFAFSTQAIGEGVLPSASTFGWSTAAVGVETLSGSAASEFGWSTAGASSLTVVGPAASSFTFATEASGGEDLQPGFSNIEFGWQVEAYGELIVSDGIGASSFGWLPASIGIEDYPGQAASEFGWSPEAVAIALAPHEGLAASEFGWSTEVVGEHEVPAPQRAASTFLWSTEAAGTLVLNGIGIAASAFSWNADGNGTTTGIVDPVPPPKKPKKGRKHWPWMRPDWI